MRLLQYTLFLTICLLSAFTAWAEDTEGTEKIQEAKVEYVDLKPSIIANYVAPTLHYLKADLTLQVRGAETVKAIERQRPHIIHNLVMLFSRQDHETVSSSEGRDRLKQESLAEVIQALEAEDEPADIEAVLFTSFIVE